MSSNAYQWQRITCEEQIKYLINLRQRFCQYLKQNSNTISYNDARNYFQDDLELLDTSLIECICDLVNIHESFSNEASRKFLVELKCQQSIYTNDTLDQSVKRIYFNRRYRALINSREILLDDLSTSIEGNKLNRMIKIRAVCVLDEELNRIQEVLTSKSIEEQLAIRLHQIRATINVYFKQSSQTSFEDLSAMTLLVHSCDSLLSLFRLLFNSVNSDASFNSSLDIQREYK
ncbi:unnamed protein product [Rotaria magnacalcarata]|uniref:Uncharacterized protein n=2 Tax=Rotaria magnacalcarata TaxID=392030 RepID=A0A816W9J3_9BILA|nr:unnamed protein product [Rotaria magnacalcarata]CAF2011856.1 unnamed protein product [Rotaria magnacalcarata]CAF2097675.1 unnamed protein product [Rotaria magnacalcarata]CAF2134464.1 unnamed protein product [Rotaria magnacalcarata]